MNSYFSHAYERFFLLYGNIDDEFCSPNLEILSLEEMLHRHLRSLGYERIIFYNGRQKIYFHDVISLEKTQELSEPKTDNIPLSPSQITEGPLGELFLLNADNSEEIIDFKEEEEHSLVEDAELLNTYVDKSHTESNNSPAKQTGTLQLGKIPDSDVVSIVARCMQEEIPKTAIIFTDGLDFILHFEATARRQIASLLYRCGQLPSTNHNLCIFLLPSTEFPHLRNLLERHEWHFLLNQFFDHDNTPSHRTIFIGSPQQDEITNLFHYWRLKRTLPTHWKTLQNIIQPLTSRLCAENKTLKALSYQIQQFNEFSLTTFHQLAGYSQQPPALERLRNYRGLESVLNKLEHLVTRAQEKSEFTPKNPRLLSFVKRLLPPAPIDKSRPNLHIVLKGNPGTGKTLAAQLIAEVFRDMGLLPIGHFMKVSREDLVSSYVGYTAIQTAQKIAHAIGGVLFIDEAYRLSDGNENDFGREAIETLMEAMSEHEGEFAVIIAGYPDPIEKFLDINVGLRRRFNENNIITIQDYTPDILQFIFEQTVKRENRKIHPTLEEQLPTLFNNWYMTRDPKIFGNAGEILNLYQAMDEKRSIRVRKQLEYQARFTLTIADIPEEKQIFLKNKISYSLDAHIQSLENLVGLHAVKKMVRNMINTVKIQQLRRENSYLNAGHYLFIGNPGTGKTTVARLMGNIFKTLNILKKGHVIEVGRVDLVAGYAGQSALKTQAIIERSLDGVLFIDEAYQLFQNENDVFGREALDRLLIAMENYRERLCVIVAGYPEPMQQFLLSNTGLPSRFTRKIIFENYTADEMLKIFEIMAQERKLTFSEIVKHTLKQRFQIWEEQDDLFFGNAREIRNLLDEMCIRQNNRLIEDNITQIDLLYHLEVSDIP